MLKNVKKVLTVILFCHIINKSSRSDTDEAIEPFGIAEVMKKIFKKELT